MKRPVVSLPLRHGLALLPLIASCGAIAADATAGEDREQQARQLVQRFVGELKPLLLSSVQRQGAAGAISVCAEKAPGIAEELGRESGWQVRRVSLRPRNAALAVPDPWEREVLKEFDERSAAGAGAADLRRGEVVDGRYRYMQGQVVEGVCLLCHGANIEPAVAAALAEHYPEDAATGYEPGEVRGAISLAAPEN